MSINFVSWDDVIYLHQEQLKLYGGQDGFIDRGVIESALNRPRFTAQYTQDADLADLAADYLFGLATTQGFSDGNKRTAVVVTERFLELNGWETALSSMLIYVVVMSVVRGDVDRDGLADLLRDHIREISE